MKSRCTSPGFSGKAERQEASRVAELSSGRVGVGRVAEGEGKGGDSGRGYWTNSGDAIKAYKAVVR